MSKPVGFFLPLIFFYQNNVIFTSYTIKNSIDPGKLGHSTPPMNQDMMGVDFYVGF